MVEAKVRSINSDSSLGTDYQYRNSVCLFAIVDHAKKQMHIGAMYARVRPLRRALRAAHRGGRDEKSTEANLV